MSEAYGQTLVPVHLLQLKYIFLSSIFNIDQRGISGRHAFLKPESSKSGHWNLRMEGQSGARRKSAAPEGGVRAGWGGGCIWRGDSQASGWM